jgi:hypothetical protein
MRELAKPANRAGFGYPELVEYEALIELERSMLAAGTSSLVR